MTTEEIMDSNRIEIIRLKRIIKDLIEQLKAEFQVLNATVTFKQRRGVTEVHCISRSSPSW